MEIKKLLALAVAGLALIGSVQALQKAWKAL
jgi:hypothetical protein